jgi:hypothetical protein
MQDNVTELARILTGWSVAGPKSEAGAPGAVLFKPNWQFVVAAARVTVLSQKMRISISKVSTCSGCRFGEICEHMQEATKFRVIENRGVYSIAPMR